VTIAKALTVLLTIPIMVNYNFFSSFGVCKLLVGVYSSPGLSRQEAGLMGKKTRLSPALQEVKRAIAAFFDEKKGLKPVGGLVEKIWRGGDLSKFQSKT